jgi:hypothetical protein
MQSCIFSELGMYDIRFEQWKTAVSSIHVSTPQNCFSKMSYLRAGLAALGATAAVVELA